ncbi:zinc finger CCCH domain-containing protein 43 [Lactuca sativa]|uniref:zinc finger CCCH domain-containing protein 43 n=1 Tax=Lactuca sativa TaxID=4236 RepID=UPI000CD9F49E|nr:zinc finger CCCH domain-containing protein 43 [Lactuca sativa]
MAKKVDKDCAVFVSTGYCSFGDFCKFRHPTLKTTDKVDYRFHISNKIRDLLGLVEKVQKEGNNGSSSGKESDKSSPIIPCKGQQDCAFYMRNGSCGYGVDCKYHHPDPIYDPYEQHGNGYGFDYQHQSFGNMNGEYYPNAPLMTDSTVQPTINAWNGNQGMAANPGFYGTDNYYPAKESSLVLNEEGLPLRPIQITIGRSVCWHYEKSGVCIFGIACAFDHPPIFSPAFYDDVIEGSTSQSAPHDDNNPETQE